MLASESQLALWTKRDRKTVRAKLINLPHTIGDKSAKLYESDIALGILYGLDKNAAKGAISPQEAAKRLTVKRTEEIDLNMEVTRRERIPLEDVEEHNDAVLQNVAGIFKASEGKRLTPELIQEIFGELRRMDEILRDYSRKAHQPETREPEPENWEKDPMLE